jgi:putative ABC transport system substrate-binding protein
MISKCDRRRAIGFASALLLGGTGRTARAQASNGVARIGLLWFDTEPPPGIAHEDGSFLKGMSELGYAEGRNVSYERRYGDRRLDRLALAAAELVRLKVDVIVAGGPAPLAAATAATRTIPIVSVGGSDPVREGWARSLAHPGGNVTGLTVTYPGMDSKRLQILKEALPHATRMAVLFAPDDVDLQQTRQGLLEGAGQIGVELLLLEARRADDIATAFDAARRSATHAMLAVGTNLIVAQRARIAALALELRLATISDFPLMVRSGLMMSYGADLNELVYRAAGFVDRIIKGARPAEMAIERPTKLRLTVSLKTARAIGLTLPAALLQRVDEVID